MTVTITLTLNRLFNIYLVSSLNLFKIIYIEVLKKPFGMFPSPCKLTK